MTTKSAMSLHAFAMDIFKSRFLFLCPHPLHGEVPKCFESIYTPYNSVFMLPHYFSVQATCYWPDGSTVTQTQGNYVPCNDSGNSTCCLETESCLTNGLCFGGYLEFIYRGACTDRSWSTPACPNQYCPLGMFTTRKEDIANP